MDTDILLLNAAKKMNDEALSRIFDQYASPIYRYALRLCDDPLRADEIVGAVFARFLEKLSSGAGPAANLRSYLYETAYQLICTDVDYGQWSRRLDGQYQIPVTGQSLPRNGENRELLQAMLRVIKYDLTEDQRHVLYLRFLEGFSLKETAVIIGKKVGNVKVIQNRAVTALRRSLIHQGFEIADPPLDVGDFLSSHFAGTKVGYHRRLALT
jgi:RNA polymerase sigma-70 factor (ECF subfamily)